MRIVVTGARGFLGSNLRTRLREAGFTDVVPLPHDAGDATLGVTLEGADFVFHLAGVNRPPREDEFASGNAGFTERVASALAAAATRRGRTIPVAYASSTQAASDNAYGKSKRAAEQSLARYGEATGAPVYLFRLTNVFGKWSRPNYNSAVATLCHNLARGLPIQIHDDKAALRLLYVDDVCSALLALLQQPGGPGGFVEVEPVYATTVGELAATLRSFVESRSTLLAPPVGTGLARALWATYLSFLPPESFAYTVPRYADQRGEFVELVRTPDRGQLSYFTAHPGITRGEHYHHSKTEKFLVLQGKARFGFRHVDTDDRYEIVVEGGQGRVVETVPGWTHNVTNVGDTELIVMLWASELFDRERPDTVAMKVQP
ncbi:MAG: SDR family oxidoreductase [Deltaproteobacteria bacterium]|nr:SDR family oxidoreductase [Deltaproteobacteria bacterium]